MPSVMDKTSKTKWKRKKCGCIVTELRNAGPVVIQCEGHRGTPDKKGRTLCFFDEEGIVRREGDVAPPRAKVEEKPREEFVYFLRVGKRIKIGYSNDPERRARDLQAELIGFAPGGRQLEAALHYDLREYRDRKEWYRDKPAVRIAMNKVLRLK